MPHTFCTLVDSAYLPRALALAKSLARYAPDAPLHIVAMDEATISVLRQLRLPHVIPHPLEELERWDSDLVKTKDARSLAEYCWTAKASTVLRVLELEPHADTVTYVDADIELFSNVDALLNELRNASVGIVAHNYARPYQKYEATSGIYNAGWVSFRNDLHARSVLAWWRERCLEWCYHRYEDGKAFDQKYLEEWPRHFEGVRVLRNIGAGVAPWNVSKYTLEGEGDRITVDGQPLVFYHYHSLRVFEPTVAARIASHLSREPRRADLLWTTGYPASPIERRLIWNPYLRRLAHETAVVRSTLPGLAGGLTRWPAREHPASRRAMRLMRSSLRPVRRLALWRPAVSG